MLITSGDWNAKVGEGKVMGIVGKWNLGRRNGRRENLIDFLPIMNVSLQILCARSQKEGSIHVPHQMDNTKTKLITSYASNVGKVQ